MTEVQKKIEECKMRITKLRLESIDGKLRMLSFKARALECSLMEAQDFLMK